MDTFKTLSVGFILITMTSMIINTFFGCLFLSIGFYYIIPMLLIYTSISMTKKIIKEVEL